MILQTNSPIYEQIYEEYKKLIKLGVLKDGDKLPSVRELGIELGINPNTVSRAYDLLIKEGYAKALEKKGIYVDYKEGNLEIRNDEVKKQIKKIKDSGVDKDKVIEIIDEVYGGQLWLKSKIYLKVLEIKVY